MNAKQKRCAWIRWLTAVGAGRFYDAFVRIAQNAESRCVRCDQPIYLDVGPNWRTQEGDYGCGRRDGNHVSLKLTRRRRTARG